ncbi:MAG TPA: penicillin-binding transpeptidase domain-containing protein [Candidatus Paceibacterota bacterium]|nr:penicillin-binding transpeptidase domain-containing protein [Candidatus Paceibacterota bacterium]
MAFPFRIGWRRSYRITPERDDWVAPEETLVDASSAHADIEVPVNDGVFRGAGFVLLAIAAILVVGTGRLAIDRHDELALLAWRNRTVNVAVPPPRGVIMDRTGVPLVQNVPSFDLLVISRQVNRNDDGTFPDIVPLAQALGRSPEDVTLALADGVRSNAVFFLATDLDRDAVLALSDALPQGFSVITTTKRAYPNGATFSHVLGYVGKVSKDDIARDPYYLPSDTVGRLGIEAAYETVLRGEHGRLEFDATGQPVEVSAGPGDNVVLAVDAEVQQHLFSALRTVLLETGLTQAAAVAQDPRSGSVLGMVSFPTYDNNVFSGPLSQEDVDGLFNNPRRPLFNRVIAGLYNPGSTIKPVIGMAALQENVIAPDTLVNHDCISISIPNPANPDDPYVFGNWRIDTGWFDLTRAIADSCNIFFYTVGGGFGDIGGLGVNSIVHYLTSMFANVILGIDLPGEEAGIVPTPEWKEDTTGLPWYTGDTYNISIGQGDLVVTPLWINTYVSAIANGGTLWQPQVATRVVDQDMHPVEIFPPISLGHLPFSDTTIAAMQHAMRQTVVTGTGKTLQDIGVTAAAKTGTAEVVKGKRINSLVTVYAPVENPEIALTVLVEGSTENQGHALRAARQFLQWYFGSAGVSLSSSPAPVAF